MKKLTIKDIINAKMEQKENDKKKIKEIEIGALGGKIEIEKQKILDVAELLDEPTQKTQENILFMRNLIYMHCPIFRNQELIDFYNCIEKEDVVLEVLEQDIQQLIKITEEIFSLYNLDMGEIDNEIKK